MVSLWRLRITWWMMNKDQQKVIRFGCAFLFGTKSRERKMVVDVEILILQSIRFFIYSQCWENKCSVSIMRCQKRIRPIEATTIQRLTNCLSLFSWKILTLDSLFTRKWVMGFFMLFINTLDHEIYPEIKLHSFFFSLFIGEWMAICPRSSFFVRR